MEECIRTWTVQMKWIDQHVIRMSKIHSSDKDQHDIRMLKGQVTDISYEHSKFKWKGQTCNRTLPQTSIKKSTDKQN